MRLIYNNLVDIASSLVADPVGIGSTNNLKNDRKSSVHRFQNLISDTVKYTLTWTTPQLINAIALPATNLLDSATINVRLFASIGTTSPHTQSGTTFAAKDRLIQLPGNVTLPNYTHFSIGGATKTSIWFPGLATTTQKLEIIMAGTANIDCSRIVCGKYWEPARQVSRGITLGIQDSSESSVTRNGDVYINKTYIRESMQFELQYFTDSDRKQLLDIFRSWGSSNYVYVSVFPDNLNTEISRSYSIYGKSSDISLQYDIVNYYTTSLNLESW